MAAAPATRQWDPQPYKHTDAHGRTRTGAEKSRFGKDKQSIKQGPTTAHSSLRSTSPCRPIAKQPLPHLVFPAKLYAAAPLLPYTGRRVCVQSTQPCTDDLELSQTSVEERVPRVWNQRQCHWKRIRAFANSEVKDRCHGEKVRWE